MLQTLRAIFATALIVAGGLAVAAPAAGGDPPLDDALAWTQGKGSRHVYVYADPDCGWCRHLEGELASLPDVTVHVFLYPITGRESRARAEAIWCAADRGAAWQAWMRRRQEPVAAASCDTGALDRNLERGRASGVVGTPTLWFADGALVAGSLEAAEIERTLAQVAR